MISRTCESPSHGASRQLLGIVAFIFLLSFFFAIYTQTEFQRPRLVRIQPVPLFRFHKDGDYTEQIKEGFLVYSDNCQIPDVDPYHPTVRRLVREEPTLNCSADYPPVTSTKGNVLHIRQDLITTNKSGALKCCYRIITRENGVASDNSVDVSKRCEDVFHGDILEEDFIKVECRFEGNNAVVYHNYHSFVHEKPDVEKRCNSATPQGDPPYSILIIGADATSRLNMHRQFKRTLKYFTESMGAFEMFGFNKVGDNTLPNLIPLLLGVRLEELPVLCRKESEPFDGCPFIWKSFAKRGYRTLYAEDTPSISSFNYLKKGFFEQPTDYYYRPFMKLLESDLGRRKELNCYTCVGSVSEVESVLGWVGKFASMFAKRPYFAFTWTNSLTHDYINTGSSGDVFYESFFKRLHQRGELNRTVVMFMGDHGLRWGEIRSTFIGRMEERLPMLLVSFPEEFKRRYPSAMKSFRTNSRRLITQFDLFATLQNLLDFKGNASMVDPSGMPRTLVTNFTRRALSLFEPVPADRSCADADIDEHWCTCQISSPTNVDDAEVKHVAEFVVNSLNHMLEPKQMCVPLELVNITNALLRSPHRYLRAKSEFDIFDYSVTIMTRPNWAIYESTVRYVPHKHTHDLLGEVSRLNLYGNQSHCVADRILKKYCLCRDMVKVSQ